MEDSIVIQTSGLKKTYPGAVPVEALRGVDLVIRRGEFTAVVGPSGSGKSTLLNIIGGLDEPTSGSVIVSGTDLSTLTKAGTVRFRRDKIGFVFQSFNLIPVLTAEENVEFIMLLQGISKRERHERTHRLLGEVGLTLEQIHKRPSKLSGGQQQRVAVARALATKPAFVLADEPTANLDSVSTGNLLDMMADLNRVEDMTFIFSTHDQRVIDRARRVITLEDGRIISDVEQDVPAAASS
jgi:putative ABC transport system ATP-binding protein